MWQSLIFVVILDETIADNDLTMLVFFIHGVATHDVQYADKLKSLIKEEFIQREKPLPYFYSSFWGDVLMFIYLILIRFVNLQDMLV